MIKQLVDYHAFPSLKVDKLLNNADIDLIRFAHVIRGWSNNNLAGTQFYEAIAESLSMIVLTGDTFVRSLTHIHSPAPDRIEIRNVYRAGFESLPMRTIVPTVSFELISGGSNSDAGVGLNDCLKRLREDLKSSYGDCGKIATPAVEVLKYLSYRKWWATVITTNGTKQVIDLTNGISTVQVRIDHEPLRLDHAAIRNYQETRNL